MPNCPVLLLYVTPPPPDIVALTSDIRGAVNVNTPALYDKCELDNRSLSPGVVTLVLENCPKT